MFGENQISRGDDMWMRQRLAWAMKSIILGLAIAWAFSVKALQVTNCFDRIDYGYGLYHLRCNLPAFSKIDFCVELKNPGWSVVEHSDVVGVKIYKAREGISVKAYAQSYGVLSFESSSPTADEIPICFAWNVDEDWYYGWIYALRENGEVIIKDSCVETIANRTLCYRYLEIRDGSEVKHSWIGEVQWTYRMFDTYISLGGGTDDTPAVSTKTKGNLALPTTQFDVGPVTEIADYAFFNCKGIASVEIPDTVKSIGDYAFSGCSGLTSVVIPQGVTNIGECAFLGCYGLKSVTIPVGVANIGFGAFSGCQSVEEAVLPGSISSLDLGSLERLEIAPGATEIVGHAFENCRRIKSVQIPNSVTNIGESAFSGTALTSVEIPLSVTDIGKQAFWSCHDLGSVSLQDGLKSIGDSAFTYCYNLHSISIPSSTVTIGRSVFYGCKQLADINVDEENPSYSVVDQVLYNKGLSELKFMPTSRRNIVIPASVNEIEISFNDYPDLECIVVAPGSVSYRSYDGILYSGDGETLLRCPIAKDTATIAGGTKYVEAWAFAYCDQLKNVVIPEGVESFKWSVFYGCSNLETVSLPATLTSMSEQVFYGCHKLQMINVAEACSKYKSIGGVLYNQDGNTLVVLPPGLKSYVVPGGVTSIGYPGFYNCTNLVSIAIPKSVTNFHSGALNLCEDLTIFTDEGDSNRVRGLIKDICTQYQLDRMNFVETLNVKIPDGPTINSRWAKNYGEFEACFGNDFAAALMMSTMKRDGNGNELLVWQDFVAGTDPTDPDDKFTSKIEIVDGVPKITWEPMLSPAEAAKRQYVTYGKVELSDSEWSVVDGDEANYKFFKVEVRMR